MGDRDNLPELPQGWVWATFEQVSDRVTVGHVGSMKNEYIEDGIPFLRSQNVRENRFDPDGLKFISRKFHEQLKKSSLQPGDLVVVRSGSVGVACVIPETLKEANCSDLVIVKQPRAINPHYGAFYMNSIAQSRVKAQQVGIALTHFNTKSMAVMPVPVPPLAEQNRIVAKIDELFTQLDAGVELLKKLQAKLKRYRQAVLKAAVEGKLTKDWREAHQGELEPASVLLERILKERREKWEAEQLAQMKAKGKTPKDDSWKLKYKEPVAPDISDLPEVPEGWVWASTQQLGEVQLGRQRSPKNRSKDYPTKYIRAANITEKGLDLSDVLDMEFEPHEWERYRLRDGDILLSEASGSPDQVGKPAIWREQIPHCCFQNTVIRLRALNLSSEYLLIVFKSFYFNGLFARVAAGVGINHLSANKFCAIAVPLAPLLEQDYIITTVDYHISIAEKLEAIIEVNLKRAERLRQSILKKAFEGKLVPQDPTDEPADKLLERIKAEKAKREAEAKAKKKRKQPGKSQQLELF